MMATSDSPKEKPVRSTARKILRGVLWFFGGLISLLVLLIAGTVLFLSTDKGKEFAVRKGLELYNDSIPGQVEVERVTIHWLSEIDIRGVRLLTPAGQPVVTVDRALAHYRLLDLLHKKASVDLVRVEKPQITLLYDAQGVFNLDAALGEKPPDDNKPWDGTLPVNVDVDKAQITEGLFTLTDQRLEKPDVAGLNHLMLEGAYHYLKERHEVSIEPLTLELTAPKVGQASVRTRLAYSIREGAQTIALDQLAVEAPGLKVTGQGRITGFEAPEGRIQIVADPISADFIKIFAPTAPLEDHVALHVDATGDGKHLVKLDSSLKLPRGLVTLTGTVDISKLGEDKGEVGYDLALAANDVELAPLLTTETPPISPTSLTAVLKGSGLTPATMDTEVRLDIAPVDYERYHFEGGTISAHVDHNVITLADSRVDSPYGRLTAHGRIDLDGPLDATAKLEVDDLRPLGAQLGIPVRGAAVLDAQARGKMTAPDIDYHLTGQQLAYGKRGSEAVRVRQIQVEGQVLLPQDDKGAVQPDITARSSGAHLYSGPLRLKTFQIDARFKQPVADVTLEARDLQNQPVRLAANARIGTSQIIKVRVLEAPLGSTNWKLKQEMQVVVAPKQIDISPFLIAGADGELGGGGTWSATARNDLAIHAHGLNLKNFAPMMPESLAKLQGVIQLEAKIAGPASAPALSLISKLEGVGAASVPPFSGTLRLTNDGAVGRRTALQADLAFRDGGKVVARLNVPISVSAAGATVFHDQEAVGGMVRLQEFNLGIVGALGGESTKGLSGKLSAWMRVEGTRKTPELSLQAAGRRIALQGQRTMDADIDLKWLNDRLNLDASVSNPDVQQEALITARMDLPIVLSKDMIPQPQWDQPIDGSIKIDARQARALAPLSPAFERVKGLLAVDFTVKGNARNPQILAQVRARQMVFQPYPATNLDVDIAYGQGEVAVLTRTQVADQPTAVIQAKLKAPLERLLDGQKLELSDLHGVVDIPGLDLMVLPASVRGPQLTSGSLKLRGTFDSPGPIPTLHLEGQIANLTISGGDVHTVSLNTDFADKNLKVGAKAVTGTVLEADISGLIPMVVQLPLGNGAYAMNFEQGMDIKANIPGLDIRLLNAFLPNRATLAGVVRGEARLTGALNAPDVQGNMRLSRGQLFLPADGVFYDQIRLAAHFTSKELRLDEATFRGGRGHLNIEGGLEMQNGTPGALDVTAKFKDFVALDGPRGTGTVNGDIHIAGSASSPAITGELTIPHAVVKLPDFASNMVLQVAGLQSDKKLAPQELPSQVYILTPDGGVPWYEHVTGNEAKQESSFTPDMNILIHLPRDTWIQNEAQEIIAEVKGDVRLVADKGSYRLEGEVNTVRGEINLFAEPLVVKQGTITFTGGSEIDPLLDITAEAKVGSYGTVTMTVQGKSSSPRIDFTTDQPQYDTSDALALLVIGKPLSEEPGASEKIDAKLQSLAAGALSGWARKQVASKLPIDLLEFKATSFASADLRVGKYITPRLFLVYRRHVGEKSDDENENEAQAEYQLTRDVYLETFYGDKNIWGAQVTWRNYY